MNTVHVFQLSPVIGEKPLKLFCDSQLNSFKVTPAKFAHLVFEYIGLYVFIVRKEIVIYVHFYLGKISKHALSFRW